MTTTSLTVGADALLESLTRARDQCHRQADDLRDAIEAARGRYHRRVFAIVDEHQAARESRPYAHDAMDAWGERNATYAYAHTVIDDDDVRERARPRS